MTTFAEKINETNSEKLILCHIEPSERLILWTNHSGAVYYRDVDYYVIAAYEDGAALTANTSTSLSASEYYFDATAKRLYVRMSDDADPKNNNCHADYRLFFANKGLNLPYNLTIGSTDVSYEGNLLDGSDLKQALDIDLTGIALENDISISFDNNGGFFDDIFDTLIWENKKIEFYFWFDGITIAEAQKVFSGFIENKDYSSKKVKFSCKDQLYYLRSTLNYGKYSSSDGSPQAAFLNKPKRRIYGRADGVRCVPIDAVNEGFYFDNQNSIVYGEYQNSFIELAGSGDFLEEISPGDKLVIDIQGIEESITVDNIESSTKINLASELDFSFSTTSVKVVPEIPSRYFNREWNICGHKLREPTTTIATVVQENRYNLTDATDFEADAVVNVDGEISVVKRMTGDLMVLKQATQLSPIAGDTVKRLPISRVFNGKDEFYHIRDFTYTNTSSGCKIVFNSLAEFNAAGVKNISGTFSFVNGSRSISVTGKDVENILKPRDWIINGTDLSHQVWYEIADVAEGSVTLRTAYAGSNSSTTAKYKAPNYFDDDSVITANVLGYEDASGNWLKSCGQVVKHIITNDAGLNNYDSDSFDNSDILAPQLLSLVSPESYNGREEKIRDLINKVNKSVFGSLVNTLAFDLKYDVLDSYKPPTLAAIEDDDIDSWSVKTKNNILSRVITRYRHGEDRFTGENKFESYDYTNDYVSKFIGISNQLEVDLYLYDSNGAETITQRIAFINSVSNSIVSVVAKSVFTLKNLNDTVWLKLDRIYKRFSNRDRAKIVKVQSIRKDGKNTRLELADLGNTFNRVMSVAPNTANDFSSASDDEKIFNCFICDNTTETPDATSDVEIGTNLIG